MYKPTQPRHQESHCLIQCSSQRNFQHQICDWTVHHRFNNVVLHYQKPKVRAHQNRGCPGTEYTEILNPYPWKTTTHCLIWCNSHLRIALHPKEHHNSSTPLKGIFLTALSIGCNVMHFQPVDNMALYVMGLPQHIESTSRGDSIPNRGLHWISSISCTSYIHSISVTAQIAFIGFTLQWVCYPLPDWSMIQHT